MSQTTLIGAFILFMTYVEIRCQSGDDRPYFNYDTFDFGHRRPSHSCETETMTALAEIKSEVQNLQELMVGLRKKLDPDFKWSPLHMSCPPGFQYVKLARSCYKVVYEEHNWTSADQRCQALHPGAHLAAITHRDENLGLKAYLREELPKNKHLHVCKMHSWGDQSKMLWTSGQRQNETSCSEPFVWKISKDRQLPLSHTDWNTHEPNCHKNEEHCLHLRPSDDFHWNDLTCEKMICPLCEYDLS